MSCPDIETCDIRLDKDSWQYRCLKEYKKCWRYIEKHTEKKTPKEWLEEKK